LNGRNNRRISLDSINHKGIKTIKKNLYDYFKINSIIRKRKNREVFRLHIFGKENLIKFQKQIGFLHPLKKEKLRKVIDSYPDYKWGFPREKKKLKKFANSLMERRSKVKKPYIIRINSIHKRNLTTLSNILFNLYQIESKIYERKNNHGTKYYELTIHKKSSVKKALNNDLLNEETKTKIKIN
jgi:hypothetical protein